MLSSKIPCSVLVLTRNSEATLDRCLRTLGPFAEIVVHDANSEDRTIDIAKQYGATIFRQYDTNEKSVRVSNFTEMRLKQRDAASYDWVLYLDSDEYLSEEHVSEIGSILAGCDRKTIIKFPRAPVIDGVPRVRSVMSSECVPRIHHRQTSATLKSGKTVHEKYMYDSSFREIITHHFLLVPLPSLQELILKDDRYIALEISRIQQDGYLWSQYFTWIFLREPIVILWIFVRILVHLPDFRYKDTVPFPHEWRYIRYHWRLFLAISLAMFSHPWSCGRVKGS